MKSNDIMLLQLNYIIITQQARRPHLLPILVDTKMISLAHLLHIWSRFVALTLLHEE